MHAINNNLKFQIIPTKFFNSCRLAHLPSTQKGCGFESPEDFTHQMRIEIAYLFNSIKYGLIHRYV